MGGSCPYRDRVLQVQTGGCHMFAYDTLCYLRYMVRAGEGQIHNKGAEVRTGVTTQRAWTEEDVHFRGNAASFSIGPCPDQDKKEYTCSQITCFSP